MLNQSYPGDRDRAAGNLTAAHREMLERGSAIAPEVIAERGYYSARSRADVPECFPRYQRRPGLVIPGLTVEGERRYRLRPDRPRKDKRGKPQKYEQAAGRACYLDAANPRNLDRVKDRTAPLWVVEGEKKADALISRGECAVSLAGVHTFAVKGTEGRELREDWQHIPLKGRTVYACFDSDAWTNPSVALALSRLIAALRDRGAAVLTVVLEDAPDGSKIGADDALAGGAAVAELKARARELAPEDVARERLGRNPALQDALAALEAEWWDRDWCGQADHSDRDVLWAILRAARAHGELVEGRVHAPVSWATIELEAKLSRQTVSNALDRLEAAGPIVERIKPDNPDRSGVFVLSAKVDYYGVGGSRDRGSNSDVTKVSPSSLPSRTPRLMNSSPGSRPRRGLVSGTRKVRQSPPPKPKPPQRRPGKTRGHLTDALEHAGGTLTLDEIAAELGVRTRELTRRKRPGSKGRNGWLVWWIDTGIVALEGDASEATVALTPDWRERLDEVREAGGEIEAERVAARRVADKRRAWREHRHQRRGERRSEATKPSKASVENIAASRAKRREYRERERQRAAPEPVEVDAALVEALRANIHKFPLQPHQHRSTREYASWLAGSLWAYELVEGQPPPEAVEVALHELTHAA